ncbi:histidinol-phosphatase [Thermus sp. CCB_US3_UF1]|uniref:histidinol-phosphatase HisJ family protein n=1 Tax=unclassified Thermus TaxID=2619321 RepID=UPI00023892B9|nr:MULTISPECIES: histidinol-phosphatase HisJ family protein [unclassified Thermus]AEV17163.1 histidinol-phosphatase [Thermus sp. CCB_US3_UF1]MCS6868797.1 histidinol-phosphatase HisJ family protein [Thermus sp.]MDW8357526.1 histidinol-phosphatase HisJ family protein [Thermus sp.]
MVDSHVHTPLCGHAEGAPGEYLFQAQKQGLKGLVFTDHSPMPPWYDPGSRMGLAELPFYLLALERVRETHPEVYVGIGLEADFHPGTEDFVRTLLRSYPLDYVIGSVHYLGAWPLDHPDHQGEYAWRDLKEVYRAYFREVAKAAQSGLFHAIGHLDLPKKFGHRLEEEALLELAEPALQAVAEAGLFLDVNTAGLRNPAQEVYPAPVLLQRARELGIGVVLGSDAHRPEQVGFAFREASALLRRLGYREAHYFQEGKPRAYPLSRAP